MTDKERIDHWERVINTVVDAHKRVSDAVDAAIAVGCMDPNGPLFDAIWKGFNEMLSLVDSDDWIDWFILENNYGEKAMKAGCNEHDLKPITNNRAMAELIVRFESQ